MISIIRMLLPARLKGRDTPASGKMGKIIGKNHYVGRGQQNTELCFRLSDKTRPGEESEETQAMSPADTDPAKPKDSSPDNRPVEKTPTTTSNTSTIPQPAESHGTKPTQTSSSLDQSPLHMPLIPVTPTWKRHQQEMHVRRTFLEVQSYHAALASATSQPTSKPIQEAAPAPLKHPLPLRWRDMSAVEGYVSYMDPEATHMDLPGALQGATTSSAPSAYPHSQPLVSLTDTVSGIHTASTTKRLVQGWRRVTRRLFV
ncbi:uncharacterized protein ACWYII_010356 [Salvelinus alpinus]